MASIEEDGGDMFAELTPVYCERVAVCRKVGSDMHIIYYGRVAVMARGEIQIAKRPVAYLIIPISGMEEGRKMADAERQRSSGEGDMLPLGASKLH